jgi:hypothetical protein
LEIGERLKTKKKAKQETLKAVDKEEKRRIKMVVKKKSKKKKIPIKDIHREVDERLAGADLVRLQGMQGLNRLRRAKSTVVAREKKRLTKKLGPKDPRVLNLELKEKVNRQMILDLDLETDRAKTDVSGFDEEAWNIYGYVRDSSQQTQPDLTIAIYDEKGRWLREFGYACTDQQGAFSIQYPPKGTPAKDISETKKLFLHVTDKGHNLLFKDKTPLFFGIGKLDFRDITLPSDWVPCTPPESAADDSEVPSAYWVAKGWVRDEDGNAMSGLTVSLFDKDLLFDDYLGTQITSKDGSFQFIYTSEGFIDLLEAKPDIYLKVMDQKGNIIYSSEQAVKCNMGRTEVFNIEIEGVGKTKREFPIPPEVKKKKK